MTESEYFNRQIQLWGEDTQMNLRKKKIAIIGAGGLGSTLAMSLGTSGIGEIHIIDFDKVSLHNIHRQIIFTLADENKSKAKTVVKLIESKNPFIKMVALDMDFDSFKDMENSYDLILDATDNLLARVAIDKYAKKITTPWIYASVEEFHGQVCFFDRADFGAMNIFDHKPAGIAAPMVIQIGSMQANLALRYLAGLEIDRDTLYYFHFNKTGELIVQKFSMPSE